MKVHVLCLALCLGIVVFCNGKTVRISGIPVIGIGQQIEEPVDIPLRDIASSLEIIQLETSDSLLLPDIYKLHLFDKYILIDGLLFDRTGKFLNRVYRIGEGPDEVHKRANVIQVNDGKVYTLDFSGLLKIFSLNGERLETIKSPTSTYFDFYPLNKGQFVGFNSNFQGNEKNCLEFFDKTKVLATFPYTEQHKSEASWFFPGEGKFFQSGNKLLFKRLLCDTIFQVDCNEYQLKPLYRIDFGKWTSKEYKRYSYESIGKLQTTLFTEMPFVSFLGQNQKDLFFTVIFTDMVKQRMMYSTNIYNFHDGTARSVKLKFSEDDLKIIGENGAPKPDYAKGAADDYFFPETISADGKALISWRQQTNDQNPLVIIATLK